MILVDTSVWIDFLRGRDTMYRRTLHELIEKKKTSVSPELSSPKSCKA